MEIIPLRILFFLYGISILLFKIYCLIAYHSDRFWADNVDDALFYQFIVVGGGSAGSVVAARLAEDKGVSVLLLEAGGSPKSAFDTPSVAPLLHKTDFDWQYVTEPQNDSCLGLESQSSVWPRGKILGGSSRLNFMMYVRGDPKDFDSWAKQGNDGWSYKEILPFFKKSENYNSNDKKFRGGKGPMSVEYLRWTSELANVFLEGGKSLGYRVGDLNGELTSGFTVTQVTGKEGLRHSTDAAFLSKRRSNLKVVTHAHVERLLFDGNNRAIGVQFMFKGQRKYAFASKEVVLSAGAIGSPHLLMLSGIGPQGHLKKHEIPLVKDLPGVGQNLQDHITAGANNVALNGESAKLGLNLRQMMSPSATLEYIISKSGPVSTNGCEAHALVYSSDKINRTLEPPDIQLLFFATGHSFEGGNVIKSVAGVSDEVWSTTFAPFYGKPLASIFAVLLRPKSRGTIRLKTKNAADHPVINPRYFTHKDDIPILVQGLRKVNELINSEPFKSKGAVPNRTPLPGCDQMEFDSDLYWSCYLKWLSGTVYHPCGTCKMGPATDPNAVADANLRVRSVQGLRVIDASIMPTIVGANINAATIMIGEKGAHMIRQFWYLRQISCHWSDFFVPPQLCF